jgi:protein-L-isoaspartate(D-aspartate) O-methyltransferase
VIIGFNTDAPGSGGDELDIRDLLLPTGTLADAVAQGYLSFGGDATQTTLSADLDGAAGAGAAVVMCTFHGLGFVDSATSETCSPTTFSWSEGAGIAEAVQVWQNGREHASSRRNGMRKIASLLFVLLSGASAAAQDAPDFETARAQMVQVIQIETLAASEITRVSEIDPRVLAAMGRVPRHEFVPEPLARFAYEDTPIPIDPEQNLAQPFIAALMTHLLQVEPGDTVFETGTDSGYQAAVLAELGAKVYSVEVIEPLAAAAAERLKRLDYRDVAVKAGDGYYGWVEHAPYDAILVKEAIDHLPPSLAAQLKPGGRMVVPLGPTNAAQELTLIEKDAQGNIRRRSVLPVRFAPLQGGDRT